MEIRIRRAEARDASAQAELARGLGLFGHVAAITPTATQARVARHLALCLADNRHSIYVAEDPSGNLVSHGAKHCLPYLIWAGLEG